MTQFKQTWVFILVFILLAVLAVSTFIFHGGHAYAANSELPPGLVSGLVKGAQFNILVSSGGGIGPETLTVIETNGTWVHADIVHSNIWGKGDIWVNLAATDFGYVNIIGKPVPPK